MRHLNGDLVIILGSVLKFSEVLKHRFQRGLTSFRSLSPAISLILKMGCGH